MITNNQYLLFLLTCHNFLEMYPKFRIKSSLILDTILTGHSITKYEHKHKNCTSLLIILKFLIAIPELVSCLFFFFLPAISIWTVASSSNYVSRVILLHEQVKIQNVHSFTVWSRNITKSKLY